MTGEPSIERRLELRAGLRAVHEAVPATMRGFAELHRSAMADGALSEAHKELMALAIGITQGCGDCIVLHVHDALRAGASAEEVHETVGVAVMMGGGPATLYAAQALSALRDFQASTSPAMAPAP
jgi:AhpD family alkylhydroperoxidase